MESKGEKLKKLRLEKGLSLQEVSKKTKIHLDILKAIEEDEYINLSPIYVKGFLKIYCKFLGEDPRNYLPDYKEPQATVKTVPEIKKEPASKVATNLMKLVSSSSWHIKPKIIYTTIFILIFVIALFNLGRVFSSKRNVVSKKAKLSVVNKTTAEKTKPTKKPLKASEPKTSPTETASQGDIASGIRLSMYAKDDCWVRLMTDGRVVFQSILRKGRSETWQAKDKIEFSLGNAGGVDLEINGKLIPSLGRKGQVLKNILITKKGLSIGR